MQKFAVWKERQQALRTKSSISILCPSIKYIFSFISFFLPVVDGAKPPCALYHDNNQIVHHFSRECCLLLFFSKKYGTYLNYGPFGFKYPIFRKFWFYTGLFNLFDLSQSTAHWLQNLNSLHLNFEVKMLLTDLNQINWKLNGKIKNLKVWLPNPNGL